MPDEEPIDFSAVLESWRQDLDLEASLEDLGIGDIDADAWVGLAEAEQAAGVSRSSLRTWYRSGQIPSRLVNGPHGLQRLVPLTSVVERARRSGRIPMRPERTERVRKQEAPTMSSPDALVRLAELASNMAQAAEARAAAAELALRQAIERAAAAEAELRVVRERLDRLEEPRPDLRG